MSRVTLGSAGVFEKTSCKRCGKTVYTIANKKIQARPSYQKYGGICQTCTTPEEVYELNLKAGQEKARGL